MSVTCTLIFFPLGFRNISMHFLILYSVVFESFDIDDDFSHNIYSLFEEKIYRNLIEDLNDCVFLAISSQTLFAFIDESSEFFQSTEKTNLLLFVMFNCVQMFFTGFHKALSCDHYR